MLTHGAGGNRESELLQRVCDEWARRGWLAIRYNLPYRRRRPTGPPSGSAATDRAGIDEAISLVPHPYRRPADRGGHSYGGRQTSMVVAEANPPQVDVLTLFSYPVHPPGKPERSPHRTSARHRRAHRVHPRNIGPLRHARAEVREAAALIAAPIEVVEITGARHDLRSKTLDVPALAVDAALRLLR